MIEVIIGLIAFGVLALFSWYTDKTTKASRRDRDYYDG